LIAAERTHHPLLCRGFDTFCGGFDVKAPRHRENRLDDRQMFAVARCRALHEALIDLDLREMGAAEIAE